MKQISRPEFGEYAPYTITYIDHVPNDGLVLEHLRENAKLTRALVSSLSEERLLSRYAPGKWSIKEVLVHVIDAERIFAYRALRIARNDKTPLPGFEENDYVPASQADQRVINSIVEEYAAVRLASVTLLESFTDNMLSLTGTVNGKQT